MSNPSQRYAQLAFTADDTAPQQARQFIHEHSTSLPTDVRDDALLLASELVTNAVRYGRPEIVLRLTIEASNVRVEVRDEGADLPRLPSAMPDPTQATGRGLLILDALAVRWGIATNSPAEQGKSVWFVLGRP